MFVSENGSLQTSSNGTVATLFSPFGVAGADSNNYSCVVVNETGIVTVITIDIRVMGEKLKQQYLESPSNAFKENGLKVPLIFWTFALV